MITARFQFKERDYVVSVPEQFVFDARTMLARGSISYEGLERLVQQFEYVESLSSNGVGGYEGVVIVADSAIVYAGRTVADALDWISENDVTEPALIWEFPAIEERGSLASRKSSMGASEPVIRIRQGLKA